MLLTNLLNKIVVLDPGHGGKDPGADNDASGLKEKDVTLRFCQILRDLLKASGVQVILTRTSDTALHPTKATDLAMRAGVANSANADCLVSIHCNGAERLDAQGFEIWTTKGNTISDPLATKIFNSWAGSNIKTKLRVDNSDGDPDKESNFTVIYKTKCASVLLEIGFITNNEEAALMASEEWLTASAKTVASGILKWLGLEVS